MRTYLANLLHELTSRTYFTNLLDAQDFGFTTPVNGSVHVAPMTGSVHVGIAPSFDDDAPRYALRADLGAVDRDLGAADLARFCDEYMAGKLAPSFKSAMAPVGRWEPGQLIVVVGDTLVEMVTQAEADVLLCFHAPYGFDEVNGAAPSHRLLHMHTFT